MAWCSRCGAAAPLLTPSYHPSPHPIISPHRHQPITIPQVWLLLVLAAEAPAVAGQVLCARYITTGQPADARRLLRRLLKGTALLGVASAGALLALAGPVSQLMIPSDPLLASGARRLFGWAALLTPLVAPNALLEGVLLGAGQSYRYLATSTALIATLTGCLTTLAVHVRPMPSSAWACIALFFTLRYAAWLLGAICNAAPSALRTRHIRTLPLTGAFLSRRSDRLMSASVRTFLVPRAGFGRWQPSGDDVLDGKVVPAALKAD